MASALGIPLRRRRTPHFFKVFFPTLSSERLVIPRAFWKHVGQESSRLVYLTGPSGNVWCVHLISDSSGMSFQNRWEEFVTDHSLALGDFLVFRYEGNLQFTVLIFDATASEREDAFHAVPCSEVANLEDGDEWRSLREHSTKALTVINPEADGQLISRSTGGEDNAMVVCESLSEGLVYCMEVRTRFHDDSSITDEANGQDLNVRTLGREQTTRACANLKRVSGVSMRAKSSMCSRFSPGCSLPEKHSPPTCINVVAQHKVKEEELQIEEATTSPLSGALQLQQQGANSKGFPGPENSHKSCKGSSSEKIEKHKGLGVKRSIHKKPMSSFHKNLKEESCKDHSVHVIMKRVYSRRESVNIKVRMRAAMSSRQPITEEEKKKTLEAANSFQSKHPFALAIMRDSYVYYGFYMCLPHAFIRKHFPRCDMNMILWDPSGKSWPVIYNYCEGRGGFSGGWGAFSHANNLESDDVCVFEYFKLNELRVHIFRVVEQISPLIWKKANKSI